MASEDSPNGDLEATIRALRDEINRLKDEIARLRGDRDERPPHYL
ncbi:MAG TPA: hypothetical protein VND89_05600 [Acidimicrobiales bacterium]|nr:hypothetical protein [Acidimicrobiales bacterium]